MFWGLSLNDWSFFALDFGVVVLLIVALLNENRYVDNRDWHSSMDSANDRLAAKLAKKQGSSK